LSAIIEAILLYTTVAVGPMVPEVEKTRGEKYNDMRNMIPVS